MFSFIHIIIKVLCFQSINSFASLLLIYIFLDCCKAIGTGQKLSLLVHNLECKMTRKGLFQDQKLYPALK